MTTPVGCGTRNGIEVRPLDGTPQQFMELKTEVRALHRTPAVYRTQNLGLAAGQHHSADYGIRKERSSAGRNPIAVYITGIGGSTTEQHSSAFNGT